MPIERIGEVNRGGARTDSPGLGTPNTAVTDLTRVIQPVTPQTDFEETRSPIGVPAGYGANYGATPNNIFSPEYQNQPNMRPPRYFIGDELIPANYPVERRIQMQQDLFEAGLLDATGYIKSEWDGPTAAAYKSALARSNAAGKSYDETIQELKAVVARYGRPAEERKLAPGVLELTNPSQISQLANEVAVRVMGRSLDPAQSQRFADTYNQMEREYQQQIYNLRLQGQSNTIAGEVVQPKSLDAYGKEIAGQIKAENPVESSAVTTLNAADIFFDMLRSA